MYTKIAAALLVASFTIPELEAFIGGLFLGLVQDDHLDTITKCLKDEATLQNEMTEAIADFEKKDLMSIIAGVKLIGDMMTQIEGDITDCKGMDADAKRIEAWAEIFKHPTELVETVLSNAMTNRQGLAIDITQISTDAASNDFKDMGLTVADIITKTVGAIPEVSAANAEAVYLY